MIKIKNSKIVYTLAAAALSVTLLSGCTNEYREDQLAYRQIGISSMEAGNYDEAVTAFNTALSLCVGKISETEIDICYYKAAAQYASGDVEGALETYDALIEYDGKDADAYYLRGCLLLQQGESEQALSDYENAVKYNSQDFELYVRIYENLSGYNLATEGEEYLNAAFGIKGDAAEDLAWRGKIYYLLGQYGNAITELTAALEKGSVEANLTMGQVYEAQGDSGSAESYYQAYVASGSADSEVMNALAGIEMAKGNYETALEYIEEGLAMESVPNKQALMRNEIIASEYSGDFENAWAVIQEYVALYPDDAEAEREYIFLKNRQVTDTSTDDAEESTEESTEEIPEEGTEQES